MKIALYVVGVFLMVFAVMLLFANHLNTPGISTTVTWLVIMMITGGIFAYLDWRNVKIDKAKLIISSLLCYVSALVALVLVDLMEFIGDFAWPLTLLMILISIVTGIVYLRFKKKAEQSLCGWSLVAAGMCLSLILFLIILPGMLWQLSASPQSRNANRSYSKYLKANRDIQSGKFDDALNELNDAISLKPDSAGNYATRGYIYLIKGDTAKAMADYDKAFELEANNDSKGMFYGARGDAYLKRKEYGKAIADYTKAIELISHYVKDDYYLGRAEAYFQIGEYDRAWTDVQSAPILKHVAHKDFIEKLKLQYSKK